MVPLPKRRHSTRRGGKRQAAIKLKLPTMQKESDADQEHLPHRAYKKNGKLVYRGITLK